MQKISEFKILTVKEIQSLIEVQDHKTALKYFRDIKKHYQIEKVLFCHFKDYFKVPDFSKGTKKQDD